MFYFVDFDTAQSKTGEAELKQRLVDKINEMVANDSIKLYMLSPQYQKDIKNQSLFSKDSTYFFRKQFPVSEKLTSEIDIHIMTKAKVLPGPQVFAIKTFVFQSFFEDSQLLDPIYSQPPTSKEIEKELDETRKETDKRLMNKYGSYRKK